MIHLQRGRGTNNSVTPTRLSSIGGVDGVDKFDAYLQAHDDDWLYFMSPNIYYDLKSGDRVLLIDVTSGSPDANQPSTGTSLPLALRWSNAREAAESAAFAYLANASLSGSGSLRVNSHSITYATYGAFVIIHMRLVTPAAGQLLCGGTDQNFANTEGYGWPIMNCQSLGQLHILNKPISAIDSSTTYNSWGNLVSTVQGVLDYYGAPHNALTTLNTPEYDRSLDTLTHPDHIEVGNIGHELCVNGYTMRYYLSYTTQDLAANISGADLTIKKNAWQQYENVVNQVWGSTVNDYPTHGQWLPRQYYRTTVAVS